MITFLETLPEDKAHRALLQAAHPDWAGDQAERVRAAFAHSEWCACALNEQDELVGTIRVVSDRVAFALIADLLVHPDFRHQGIATALLEMAQHYYQGFILYADPQSAELHPLYTKAGFETHNVWRKRC